MSHNLKDYVNKRILILTVDARTLVGNLETYDQSTNLVLSNTIERIIRPRDDPEPSETTEHGLYLVRGDNVCIIGLMNEELDASIDWEKVKGGPIGSTKHV